ncbi:TIGR00282 family metallophosphoesterase [Sulfurimonas sp. MAG313]|nr:TIGR00282 family metallophosphoesterase [Sulfurimonas sp. MAG313]MDF1881920.1 TIGR00282 family metallophosphoesterase [Sulfurimonas sp. MAG313]
MRIAFIGDIVGRPGRSIIKENLKKIKDEHHIDFVIANYENASHGFGLTSKSAAELFNTGINVMTGGNHTWDKKEIHTLFDKYELLRPHNYPDEVSGTGCKIYEVAGEKLAVLNLMGHFSMPMTDNPFRCAKETISDLHEQGVQNIFIDIHAEATAEKRALLMMCKSQVSAIVGTHTHVSTDDLQIYEGTGYLTDIGLTGCRDNVIGMSAKIPIQRFLTGLPGRFDVPDKCKSILQMVIFDISAGKCTKAFKIKKFNDGREFQTEAWID